MAIIEGKLARVELDLCGDSGITFVDDSGNRVRLTPESDGWQLSIEVDDPPTTEGRWPMEPNQPFVG